MQPETMTPTTPGEDDESDLDDEDEEEANQWNIRKCSASTIDVMASVYGDDLLLTLLPLVNEQLFHQDWKRREAGILALGAIAEGCPHGMEQHLATIVPLLLNCLQDPKVSVSNASLWFGQLLAGPLEDTRIGLFLRGR
jgi:transportin-1